MNIGGRYEIDTENGSHIFEFLGLDEDKGAKVRWEETDYETVIEFVGIVHLIQHDAIRELVE